MKINTSSGKVITADFEAGNKPAPWTHAGRHYIITVKVGRKSAAFDFWDSHHNRVNHIPCDLRGAVACWAGDALVDAFDQYDDLGSVTGQMVKGCIKALADARRLGLTDEELQELSDY